MSSGKRPTTNRVRMQISASRRTECLTKTPSLAVRASWSESVSNLPGPFKASDSWITDFRLNYQGYPLDKTAARNIDLAELCAHFFDFWWYIRNSRDAAGEWNTCRTCTDRKYSYSIYQILIHLVGYTSNIARIALYISARILWESYSWNQFLSLLFALIV